MSNKENRSSKDMFLKKKLLLLKKAEERNEKTISNHRNHCPAHKSREFLQLTRF